MWGFPKIGGVPRKQHSELRDFRDEGLGCKVLGFRDNRHS